MWRQIGWRAYVLRGLAGWCAEEGMADYPAVAVQSNVIYTRCRSTTEATYESLGDWTGDLCAESRSSLFAQ